MTSGGLGFLGVRVGTYSLVALGIVVPAMGVAVAIPWLWYTLVSSVAASDDAHASAFPIALLPAWVAPPLQDNATLSRWCAILQAMCALLGVLTALMAFACVALLCLSRINPHHGVRGRWARKGLSTLQTVMLVAMLALAAVMLWTAAVSGPALRSAAVESRLRQLDKMPNRMSHHPVVLGSEAIELYFRMACQYWPLSITLMLVTFATATN